MQMNALDRARAIAQGRIGITPQQYGMRRILSILSTDDDITEKFVRMAKAIRDLNDEEADAVLTWIEANSYKPIKIPGES